MNVRVGKTMGKHRCHLKETIKEAAPESEKKSNVLKCYLIKITCGSESVFMGNSILLSVNDRSTRKLISYLKKYLKTNFSLNETKWLK